MSLATLHNAQQEAAQLLGVDMRQLEAQQQQEVHHGTIQLNGEPLDAYRVLTGPGDKIGKGGIRFNTYPDAAATEAEARELSGEMAVKLAARGHHDTFRGGKGVVNIRGRRLSPADKEHIAREFEAFMEEAGLANYRKDIPAGDVGTNGLSDHYAREYGRKHPDDPYALAVITGKSPENGGLEARAGATGLGVLSAQHALMERRGVEHATVSLQGFGNVASWYAYFAHSDPQRRVSVQAISEPEGVLWTLDPAGLPITEDMVQLIGDNKDWTGPKIEALAQMILAKNPNFDLRFKPQSSDIITHPADYFVPAAMGNAITSDNVLKMGARLGVIEAGNGTTTPGAHRVLVGRGLDVVADVGANSGGVDTSIKEWEANIAMAEGRITAMPGREEIERALIRSSARLMHDTVHMAEILDTRDLRVAVAALAMERTLNLDRVEDSA